MGTTTVYGGGGQIAANLSTVANVRDGVDSVAIDSVGVLETVSGLTVVEKGDGAVHKTVITLAEVIMTTADGSVPATDGMWSTLKLYTFPQGHIGILTSHMTCPITGIEAVTGSGTGLSDTADLELGVGSVASANETVFGLNNGAQEDIIEAMDVDLTAKTSDSAETVVNSTVAVYDGSTTESTLNMNLRTLDDADAGVTADTVKVSGTLTVLWSNIGDN